MKQLNLSLNLKYKSTLNIPPQPPQQKQREKYNSCVHNTAHSDQILPVRQTILSPKQKRRLFALFSV